MSKHEEANLILKLYDLRREEVMRKARDWFFLEFHPQSLADVENAMFSEHSGHLRMVTSYWEMAAALVNQGAISLDMFDATNGEHFTVFAKLEPILAEMRAKWGERAYVNLEKLIKATPDAEQRLQAIRARIQAVRERLAAGRA
jgi:hypothetical protein